jgi:hypothetical protein
LYLVPLTYNKVKKDTKADPSTTPPSSGDLE